MKERGFTLIELLVVIAIIALLSSVVLASINASRAKTRNTTRQQDLVALRSALELYYHDNGAYPSTGSMNTVYMEMGCLQTVPSPDLKTPNWIPGLAPSYIASLPKDPKPLNGGCYMYSSTGQKYLLTAYGTVEGGSNGGKMSSEIGYRELNYMGESGSTPSCYYAPTHSGLVAVRSRSYILTNMTPTDRADCPQI